MARILVIDDDEDIRILIKTILIKEDHDVLVAKDAFEATDLIDTARFDLVISDINMPKKSGFNLVQELRRGIRHRFLTIAFLTARSSTRDIKRAIDIGADGYIVKPIQKDDFIQKINNLLAKSPSRTDLTVEIPPTFEDPLGKVIIEFKGKVQQISDLGVVVVVKHPLIEGEAVSFDSRIFSEIGVKSPIMTVSTVQPLEEGSWTAKLVYRNASHETLQNICTWIKKQKSGLKKAI